MSPARQHCHHQRQLWAQQLLQPETAWSRGKQARRQRQRPAAAAAHLSACSSKPSATSQSLRMPSWKADTTCSRAAGQGEAAAAAEARQSAGKAKQGDASAARPACVWRACVPASHAQLATHKPIGRRGSRSSPGRQILSCSHPHTSMLSLLWLIACVPTYSLRVAPPSTSMPSGPPPTAPTDCGQAAQGMEWVVL